MLNYVYLCITHYVAGRIYQLHVSVVLPQALKFTESVYRLQLAVVLSLYLQEPNVVLFRAELYKAQKIPHDMRDKQPWKDRNTVS